MHARCPKQGIFCLGLLLFTQTSALGIPASTWDAQKVKEQQKRTLEQGKDCRKLKEPVEFADLPMFNGHTKFVTGFLNSNNGVSSCSMSFLAQEDPQTVVGFYRDALVSSQWKILYTSSHTICAQHKKGHMCNINVNPSKFPKQKSQFIVNYRQIEKQ
jgi:hypothetical protein